MCPHLSGGWDTMHRAAWSETKNILSYIAIADAQLRLYVDSVTDWLDWQIAAILHDSEWEACCNLHIQNSMCNFVNPAVKLWRQETSLLEPWGWLWEPSSTGAHLEHAIEVSKTLLFTNNIGFAIYDLSTNCKQSWENNCENFPIPVLCASFYSHVNTARVKSPSCHIERSIRKKHLRGLNMLMTTQLQEATTRPLSHTELRVNLGACPGSGSERCRNGILCYTFQSNDDEVPCRLLA